MIDTSNNQASLSTLSSLPSPPVIRSWGCSPPWSRQQAAWSLLASGHGPPTTLSTLVQCCSTGRRVWPYHHDLIDMWMITCTDVYVQLSIKSYTLPHWWHIMLHLHVTVQPIQPQIIPITDFQDKKTQHIQSLQYKLWIWPLLLATWTKLWSLNVQQGELKNYNIVLPDTYIHKHIHVWLLLLGCSISNCTPPTAEKLGFLALPTPWTYRNLHVDEE